MAVVLTGHCHYRLSVTAQLTQHGDGENQGKKGECLGRKGGEYKAGKEKEGCSLKAPLCTRILSLFHLLLPLPYLSQFCAMKMTGAEPMNPMETLACPKDRQ